MNSLNTCGHSKAISIHENKNKKFNCSFLNVQYILFFSSPSSLSCDQLQNVPFPLNGYPPSSQGWCFYKLWLLLQVELKEMESLLLQVESTTNVEGVKHIHRFYNFSLQITAQLKTFVCFKQNKLFIQQCKQLNDVLLFQNNRLFLNNISHTMCCVLMIRITFSLNLFI